MDDVSPEDLIAKLEAYLRTLPGEEQKVILRLFEAMARKAEAMNSEEEAAAFIGEVLPQILELPQLWRHLNG